MKKTILFLACGLFAFSASAQKMKEADVPAAIKASFIKMHPNTKVDKWEKEGNNWEAEYTEGGVENSVEFGPNGQLIASEMEIKVADLPKAVSAYCAKNMPGKKIAEASKITDAKGVISYEAEVDETDYIFDANGNFVKKEVERDMDKDDKK
ncbi:MAG: PepSY-like domain-containing protein [Bacteroidia bacterium]